MQTLNFGKIEYGNGNYIFKFQFQIPPTHGWYGKRYRQYLLLYQNQVRGLCVGLKLERDTIHGISFFLNFPKKSDIFRTLTNSKKNQKIQ